MRTVELPDGRKFQIAGANDEVRQWIPPTTYARYNYDTKKYGTAVRKGHWRCLKKVDSLLRRQVLSAST